MGGHILYLPNEILQFIFSFVPDNDKLHLGLVCQQFNEALSFTRKLDLSLQYSCKERSFYKFFQNRVVCKNIKHLDLTSCYWFHSSIILSVVKKLDNLESLFLAFTKLNTSQLLALLENKPLLKRLSFECNITGTVKINHVPALKNIELLAISIPFETRDWTSIVGILEQCKNLKHFWVFSANPRRLPLVLDSCYPYLESVVSLSTNEDSITSGISHLFARIIMEKCFSKLKVLWLDGEKPHNPLLTHYSFWNGKIAENPVSLAVFDTVEFKAQFDDLRHVKVFEKDCVWVHLSSNMGNLQLKSLYWMLPNLPTELPRTLTVFKFDNCGVENDVVDLVDLVSAAPGLRKLCLPACVISGSPQVMDSSGATVNITKLSNYLDEHCKLDKLCSACLDIEHLELFGCPEGRCNATRKFYGLNKLESISKLKHLKVLRLDNTKIITTNFLLPITTGCENLETLNLEDFSQLPTCIELPYICLALKNCKNLKNFRLKYFNVGKTATLFEALQFCPMLERVSVISKGCTVPLEVSAVCNFIKSCKNLVFLYTFIRHTSKAISKAIKNFYKIHKENLRPSLFIFISHQDSAPQEIPAVHYVEMVCSRTLLADLPNDCNSFVLSPQCLV